jgi:hypothetical protein
MLNVMGFSPIQRAKSNVKMRDIGDSGEETIAWKKGNPSC